MLYPMTTRAALYLRVSLDATGEHLAVDRQRDICMSRFGDRGWEVTEYIDNSVSASNARKRRPAYDQMCADVDAGKIDAVVCYNLDRLTRQPRQIEDWCDRAERSDVLVYTASGDFDLSNAQGRFTARMIASFARAEVDRKSERQVAAHQQRARQGRPPKGVRPLGYTLTGEIIHGEAEVVRAMYREYAAGHTVAAIRRALDGETVPAGQSVPDVSVTPRPTHIIQVERNRRRRAEGRPEKPVTDPHPWYPMSVKRILKNPRYAGYSVYPSHDGDRIVRDEAGQPVRGQWTPIVDEKTWWQVQQRLADRAKTPGNREGVTAQRHLGGGLYRCHACGKPVISRTTAYACETRGHVSRTMVGVDDYVRRVVERRLSMPDLRNLLPRPDEDGLDDARAKIRHQEARLLRARSDYMAELIDGELYRSIHDEATARIRALNDRVTRSSVGGTTADIIGAPDPARAFREAPVPVQRQVVDTLMTVTLHKHQSGRKGFDPDEVVIDWRG